MDNVLPLISIVMCTYNGAKYLPQQLDSILQQTYPNLEVVIVDDVSKDNTWEVLQNYQKQYPHIRLYKNEQNLGYVKNFESALQKATGKFIAIADQDDIWELNKIELQQKAMGVAWIVYHDSTLVDEQGTLLGKNISDIMHLYEGDDIKALLFDNTVSGHSMLFRRELLNLALPFSTEMHYDWWLALVALSQNSIRYIDKPLVYYRQHNQNVTNIRGIRGERPATRYLKQQLRIYQRQQEYKGLLHRLNKVCALPIAKPAQHLFVTNLLKAFEQKGKQTFCYTLFRLMWKNARVLYCTRRKRHYRILKNVIRLSLFARYNALPDAQAIETLREQGFIK